MSENPTRNAFIRNAMNPLGRYLCYLWESHGHTTIKAALREAGMTPRQFNLLSFSERDRRESTIRRAVNSFGGTMAEFYSRSWDPTYDKHDEMACYLDRDLMNEIVRPKFNRPRRLTT
jgi:hypothetical protein